MTTGVLRAGDVAILKFGNIDWERQAITSLIRKTRRIHELPLASAIFKMLPKTEEDVPIFPELYADTDRKINDNIAKPRKFMQAVLKANGRPHATLHSIRHTFNQNLATL